MVVGCDARWLRSRWALFLTLVSQASLSDAAEPPASAPASATQDPQPPLDRSSDTREKRVRQFGGDRRTEDAVEAGLAWLAKHQNDDGTWSRFEFSRRCPSDDRCPGAAVDRKNSDFRIGLTGLSLLAFLGGGYTDRAGPPEYREVVARAIDFLLRSQRHDGGFGADEYMSGYNNSLATFALAEYYALTREPRVTRSLERAVERLVLSQQELGGWDYVDRPDSGRNDTSITAWAVQALQACSAAGVRVPRRVFIKAALQCDRAAEPDGRVRYSDSGTGYQIDEKTMAPIYRYGPAMVAAGLTCERLLGWRADGELVGRQQALLLEQPPSESLLTGRDPTQLHSYYYWYYGTVAMFQAGGAHWERWNARLRDAILPLQERRKNDAGESPHTYGSWPPFGPNWGKWGRQGSRVYTTALCVLTLEIYYRHAPAYLESDLALTSADWRAFLSEASRQDRLRAVRVLEQSRFETGEPTLLAMLTDPDAAIAQASAIALVSLDSPMGRRVLEHALEAAAEWERPAISRALERIREIEALPPARGAVRLYNAEHRLATLDLPRAYAGMSLRVTRDGKPIAALRVIKRFSGRTTVVAELTGELPDPPPTEGDVVIAD